MWKSKKNLEIEGYRSASMEYSTARVFAAMSMSETDENVEVILRFKVENLENRYFICLDKEDYTLYPEETEILFQAGLVAKIESIEEEKDGDPMMFNLVISDRLIRR